MCPMDVKIVSAAQGLGKTSFLRKYVGHASDRGRSVGGIASPVVYQDGQRIGYDVIDLRLETRHPLARVPVSGDPPLDVGMFAFDQGAISEGNTAIISAVMDDVDLIAIDEIGPLEFDGKGWSSALEFALLECSFQQELIVAVRSSLADEVPRRFPSPAWTGADLISPPWPSLPLR